MSPDIKYYQSFREDVFELVPVSVEKVLSLGCGAAVTESKMKHDLNISYIMGIEKNEKVANIAKAKLDDVIISDAECADLSLPQEYFDLLVCADILEHLVDPWKTLEIYSTYLKYNGHLLVSLPNVRFYYIIWRLICGRWEYKDRGIMDRTHLRFFTFHEIKKMLWETGFEIVTIKRNYRLFEPINHKYRKIARILSFYFFRDFFTFQYVILAKRSYTKQT